jgi:hypothetical protein
MPQDTKQAGGNIAATQESFRGSYDEPRGGLLGGFFGGRDMRDDKPAVMPRTPMDRFGGMAPAIGGALLGPVGALGGLALQSRRYTGIRDMFDGGGAGKAGPTFQGGQYSGLLNALGVRPRGFRDRQAGILERQQAAPTTMAGAMGGGSPAVPAVAPATRSVTSGQPPATGGSPMSPQQVYAQAPNRIGAAPMPPQWVYSQTPASGFGATGRMATPGDIAAIERMGDPTVYRYGLEDVAVGDYIPVTSQAPFVQQVLGERSLARNAPMTQMPQWRDPAVPPSRFDVRLPTQADGYAGFGRVPLGRPYDGGGAGRANTTGWYR